MDLGEKVRRARQEAGLSQRQLCGQDITRNMLSQIEHGTASPSMKTLRLLAARLGKPMSYFLEEQAVVSPNQQRMEQCRQLYDQGDFAGAEAALRGYQAPDAVYDREKTLLETCVRLALARQAMDSGREIYARQLLEDMEMEGYCAPLLQRQRLLMLGRLGQTVSHRLPSLDEELLLRGQEAWNRGQTQRARALLEAVEDQTSPRWNLLRGDVYFREGQYRQAAQCYHQAETACPSRAIPRLERCYRELEDYKRAYEYACKQKK